MGVEVGLDISAHKCHWTSHPSLPNSSLDIGTSPVKWEHTITFVGSVIQLDGNDGCAITHRLAQATKVYCAWAPYLQSKSTSFSQKVKLLVKTVFASAMWLAEAWTPTKTQNNHFDSWGARIAARCFRIRRFPSEEMGQFWRRLHRIGHQRLRRHGGGLTYRRFIQL